MLLEKMHCLQHVLPLQLLLFSDVLLFPCMSVVLDCTLLLPNTDLNSNKPTAFPRTVFARDA